MASPPSTESALHPQILARLGLALALLIGCWLTLRPFLPAILFSLAIVVSTWQVHRWLLQRLRGYRSLAALISCLVVAVLVITPTIVLVMSLGDAASWLLKAIDEWRAAGGPQLPAWLERLPIVGGVLRDWLSQIGSGSDPLARLLQQIAEPARRWALSGGRMLGWTLGQVLLAALLLFFLYRDGDSLAQRLDHTARWLGGDRGHALLATAQRSIIGVMFSVIGTALAQSTVATVGFYIAGVPNPFLLGAMTFILSMAPVGPPLIWGGAAFWLFRQGEIGWTIFMLVYGFFGISAIDNVIKPFLISRSSHLPFALTFMGVLGGILAFGVAGVFIGPTLLALAINLGQQTIFGSDAKADTTHPPA